MPAMLRPKGKALTIAERLLGISKKRKQNRRSTRMQRVFNQDTRRMR